MTLIIRLGGERQPKTSCLSLTAAVVGWRHLAALYILVFMCVRARSITKVTQSAAIPATAAAGTGNMTAARGFDAPRLAVDLS